MDFRQLKAFLAVSDSLNFTRAAEQLGYAQSSITSQIQQLETELNVKLFERIGKTVMLTHAGKRLLPYAVKILQLSKDLKDDVSNSANPSGTLTIGTSESLSISRLPVILKKYRRLFPEVSINLKLLDCPDFLPCLSNNMIDVAFAIGNKIESEYIVEEIDLIEPICVLAYPDHPLTVKQKVTSQDFENETLLLTNIGCCYRGVFLDLLTENNIAPKIALETGSIQAIKQSALSGLGICVLPKISVKEEIASGKLLPINLNIKDWGIVSQIIYHKDKWLSPALSAFLQLAKQELQCIQYREG